MFDVEIANASAIYNLYLYLAHLIDFEKGETLKLAADKIGKLVLKQKDDVRFKLLRAAIKQPKIANTVIVDLQLTKNGLSSGVFKKEKTTFVVFKGTAKGEWIDNGDGLSGNAEQNVYITYDSDGNVYSRTVKQNDFATDQQAEALNWFSYVIKKYDLSSKIIVTGHSKGGNKAQFVAINSDNVSECYSFNGQGFSPEAIEQFKDDNNFKARQQKIFSISTGNDYINVLGNQLCLPQNRYFIEWCAGLHQIEAMFNKYGQLNDVTTQGELSKYVESVSKKLMLLKPNKRSHATIGVMNIFQNIFGEKNAVNDRDVSLAQTLVGLSIAIDTILKKE